MGHLKLVISILFKVIIFFDKTFKMQNYLWGIRDLEQVNDEGKKMALFKRILLRCLQTIFQ